MRRILCSLLILILLAGCTGTQPYTATDLHQVREAYATITPIYNAFKVAYANNNAPAMNRLFARHTRACRLVDTIDSRDTIDSNTNLFEASSYLDSFCNDIESAYSGWRQAHGLSYDKSLPATIPGTYFVDGDYNMTQMARLLRHPAARCCPVQPPAPPGH